MVIIHLLTGMILQVVPLLGDSAVTRILSVSNFDPEVEIGCLSSWKEFAAQTTPLQDWCCEV